MIVFLQIVHVFIALILIALVLIQSGKGQGLSGAFGSFAGNTAQNIFGARTTDVLTKITAYVSTFFIVSALLLAFVQAKKSKSVFKSPQVKAESEVQTKEAKEIENKVKDLTNKILNKDKSEKTEKSDTKETKTEDVKKEEKTTGELQQTAEKEALKAEKTSETAEKTEDVKKDQSSE